MTDEDTDADPDADAVEQADTDADESTEPDVEGQPDLDESEQVDLGDVDLGDVDLGETEPEPDTDSDADADADESEGRDAEAADTGGDHGGDGVTSGAWGDMYVKLLTQTTNAVIEKHGDGEAVDEEHFRAVDLDDHFDAVLEKYTNSSEMPPERALVVGSLIAVSGPIAIHTDLPSQLREEVQGK